MSEIQDCTGSSGTRSIQSYGSEDQRIVITRDKKRKSLYDIMPKLFSTSEMSI